MSTPRDRPLRIFVSSRMEELQRERQAIRAALAEMEVETFVFEIDAGARPHGIQQTYLEEEENADLYVGVFWKGYGEHTIREFENACALGMDCLIYEKREDIAGGRDPSLQAFLDRVGSDETGVTIGRFDAPAELQRAVKQDVARWQARLAREALERSTAIFHGVPSRPPPDFVGRATDISVMARSLRSGQDVAIEGLPGAGKTTLALALAHHSSVRRHFRDGILWASLGPKPDVANALARWAEALRPAGASPEIIARLPRLGDRAQALRDALGQRRMLLLIDDVWDIEAARSMRCGGPACAHLVTTRDKDIAKAFAGGVNARPLEALEEAEAYQLLQLLAPEACDADAARVRGLIRAVGGLPQAVRLIGGYLGRPGTSMFGGVFEGLTARAFEEMSDPRKRLLLAEERLGSGGKKTTLEKTIRLSLQGLPRTAQNAFHCLGAFAANPESFTPEAAAAVTQADGHSLALLAGRNLLEVDTSSRRLSVHPTVADVARTKTDHASVARHAVHYVEAVQKSQGDAATIERLYGQIRWVWRQAPDDETLLVLLNTLERFQWRRGLSAETLEWCARALPAAEAKNLTPAAARVLGIMGDAERELGRYEQALASYRRAWQLWESTRQQTGPILGITLSDAELKQRADAWQISTLSFIGLTLGKLGRVDEALAEAARARALAETTNNRSKEAEALLVTAMLLRDAGRKPEAVEFAERARRMYRQLGDRTGESDCLGVLGTIHRDLDQHERALDHVRELIALQAQMGNAEGDAEARMLMASVTGARGQLEEALATAQDACAKAEASGVQALFVDSLGVVGNLLRDLGRVDEALHYYRRQLAMYDAFGNRAGRAIVLKAIATAHWRQKRYSDARTSYEHALRIYEELGDRVRQANVLETLCYVHSVVDDFDGQIARLQQAHRIWRELGDRSAQARTLAEMGGAYVYLQQHDRALEAYRMADAAFAEIGDLDGRAAALTSAAGIDERLAFEGSCGEPDPPVDEHGRLERLEDAIAVLSKAALLEPENAALRGRLQRVERRRRFAARFGVGVLERSPVVPPLVVAVGTKLTRALGRDALRPAFLSAVTGMRDAIRLSMGIRPPRVVLAENHSDVRPDAYRILLDTIPVALARLNEDERLFPGSPDDLAPLGITARAGINPVSGRAAAWVQRRDWAVVELAGQPLWTALEFISWHLQSVVRTHLARFLTHQLASDMVEHDVPHVAAELRRDPAALTALVLILRNLLEEGVPLTPFQGITETFFALYARGTERLRILQSIRLLPPVRAQLPGNHEQGTYFRLPDRVEDDVARSIRMVDTIPYLDMQPDQIKGALSLVRQAINAQPDLIAVVVENGAIRRFVRKLVELEFPRLAVISREELLSGREAGIVLAKPAESQALE